MSELNQNMIDETVVLVLDDFQRTAWEQVLDNASGHENYDYANAFYSAAESVTGPQATRASAVLRLFGDLASFHLEVGRPEEPFRAWAVTESFTSATPDGVPQYQVELLREVAPRVTNSWLRARIADFVWVRARGYPMARLAVEAYLNTAGDLTDEASTWSAPVRAFERAAQIALRMGPKSEPFTLVREYARRMVDETGVTDDGMLSHRLLALSSQYRLEEPERLLRLATDIAERSEVLADWGRAERYWLLVEDLAISARDDEARREALRRVAETYVFRAETAAGQPHIGKITAASHLQRAVEALRRAGGMQERVGDLQRLMMEYQRDIPESLVPMSFEVPLGDAIEAAERAVTGKELPEALLAFALHPYIPSYADLKRHAEEAAEKYVFKKLFPAVYHNSEGRVIARQGSTDSKDPAEREAALRVDMVQTAGLHHQVLARSSILPARRRILDEHPLRTEDFYWIVSNNPLVPPGRELLFAEAFQAGFIGDMPKAIHFLVHQLEHTVRELLRRHGVMVTGLSREGIQMERNLNTLLYDAELRDLLGDDTVFALQSLLVEKFGPNLRNQVAHGLLDYASFASDACHYLWWLSFRLVCTPIIHELRRQEAAGRSQ